MFQNDSLFGGPVNTTFADLFPNMNKFKTAYKASGIYSSNTAGQLADDDISLTYYLLYARYGNSSIKSYDRNRFEYEVWAIMFQYGPSWVAQLKLQSHLRDLLKPENISKIQDGSFIMYNQALNPGIAPATDTEEALPAINQQNTTRYKKSKLEGYAILGDLLKADVTNTYLSRFKSLFSNVVYPNHNLWYEEVED